MPYADLQSFLTDLQTRGQLKRIAAEVDPDLEITEIADRVSKSPAAGQSPPPATDPVHGQFGGHALVFDNVKDATIPCAINIFGSYDRMRLALGCDDFEQLAARVQELVKPEIPTTLMAKVKKLPELAKMANIGPKIVKHGICQQVVRIDDANLADLPIIKCWPDDAGKYITFAGMYTRCPETGTRNVGMYRAQVLGPKETAMHWHLHHDGARHHQAHAAQGKPTPLAIVLGGEPVLPYAATCPLPPDVSELLFAGFLNGKGIELVPCKTIEMDVPANAEIVIEGLVHPQEKVLEGPFGDHTGFYSLADMYPRFQVTAITHRKDPVYPTTIVGKPPQEDYYLGKATERIFLPLLKTLIPDIIDYNLPMFGAFHNCVFVKIKKYYAMQARKVMHSIWGAGQMMFSKLIVVVDEHVNVHDEQEVLFQIGANWDPKRDSEIVQGPLDILDHASPYFGAGSKMGIDATRKIAGEGVVREWAEPIVMSDEIKRAVEDRWSEYGL